MGKQKTHGEFIKEVYNLVGDEYTILSEYINANKHICIRHNKCNYEYKVKPAMFLSDRRCPLCVNRLKYTTESFGVKIKELSNEEYRVLGEYINNKTKIKIKHLVCGHEWDIRPNDFLKGHRCPQCASNLKKNTEQFQNIISKIYNNEYRLISEYINNKTSLLLKHSCGCVFKRSPYYILKNNVLCPKCYRLSKGEKYICDYLINNNINFIQHYSIDKCKNINVLSFDFVILNNNNNLLGLIEYQGKQHYESIEHWGGQENLEYTQNNDNIKYNYCLNNNIPLLCIPYWEFKNIENILNNYLKEVKYID